MIKRSNYASASWLSTKKMSTDSEPSKIDVEKV